MNTLLIEVMADDVRGGYAAAVVGLPGIAARGDTVAETIRNLADAYSGFALTLLTLDTEVS